MPSLFGAGTQISERWPLFRFGQQVAILCHKEHLILLHAVNSDFNFMSLTVFYSKVVGSDLIS